jgi:HAD superfamily phosphoserine phosphatase-like hydrolase
VTTAAETTGGPWPERRPNLVPPFLRDAPPCTDGALAVFDADGTLWRDDVADDFTQWMIRSDEIPGDRWDEYTRIYRDDAPAGCELLLTFYAGLDRAHLRERIDHWWLHHARRRWIDEVVESVHHLDARGYPVWVVSGTPTDFLLPLERVLPVRRVLGMDFALDGRGRITGDLSGIRCAGEGKARKLRAVAAERRIFVCAGNGELDRAMMHLAERVWSVYPDAEFERYCRRRGWAVLPRPDDFVEEAKLRP